MAEIAFMSVDPDHETSGHDDTENCEDLDEVDVHVPKMKEIEDHINGFKEKVEPGTEVLEICGDTVNPHKKVNAEDFKVLKVIGKGGYGTVFLVQKITKSPDKDKFYAMKVLKKAKLIRNEKNTVHTVSERNILQMLKHPFLVRLHYAFQNRSNLYIVLEYCPGGELFRYLERECFLMEDAACFYIAEIALAIGHLHSLGIIYRDLKPENILLDKDGHVKLTDFGLSKEGVGTTNTFCGTIEYMAPEIIRCAGHGRAVDWWSLGTLLFDMLSGGPPFSQEGDKKATAEKVRFPPSFSTEAIALIRGLLKKDPKERLGNKNDVEEIKEQFFFVRRGINWDDVYNRRMEPPYKPELSSDSDVSMFDPSFTGMKPIVSPGNSDDPVPADLFQGFSFVASSVMEPPRALVPDLSRLRSGQRSRANRGAGASPQKTNLGNEQMDTDTPPSTHMCGIDLRDFAIPPRTIQPHDGCSNYGGLSRVCEDDDEDNIPGAKAIRANGVGSEGVSRASHIQGHTYMPSAAKSTARPKSSVAAVTHLAAAGKPPSPTNKNTPRRLADTKPCSYPNLLITRSGETTTSNGHPSSGDLSNAMSPVTAAAAQDSLSVHSANSSASSSNNSKPHHRHHFHRQISSGSGGKDSKCSVM
ncbi:Ribosomal protein S6 kinase beta-1 [Taenia solium]|eukprot:TsM_001050300 transcript=TsM_001050300 gene=TsM_001050300